MARLYTCPTCGSPGTYPGGCARHPRPQRRPTPSNPAGHWSPGRDRNEQRRFRNALMKRDHGRCVQCGSTDDLRAAHIVGLAEGGSNDPSNGRMLCGPCDRAADPKAR